MAQRKLTNFAALLALSSLALAAPHATKRDECTGTKTRRKPWQVQVSERVRHLLIGYHRSMLTQSVKSAGSTEWRPILSYPSGPRVLSIRIG
jgi:hypothetical protein